MKLGTTCFEKDMEMACVGGAGGGGELEIHGEMGSASWQGQEKGRAQYFLPNTPRDRAVGTPKAL